MSQAQGVMDVHSHIITPGFVYALESEGRVMDEGFPLPKWNAEAQLQWMDEAGIQTSVLTLAAPQPTSPQVVRATNEAAARLCREHPDLGLETNPICVSSLKKTGLDELWDEILEAIRQDARS